MIGTKKVSSMLAQIARGVQKSESHLVTDAESSRKWDELAVDHQDLMKKNPRGRLEIPNDPDVF